MKVYRKNIFIINHVSELPVKQIGNEWYNPSGHKVALHPQINTVIHTGSDFEGYTNIRTGFNIQANSYYRFDGTKKARSRADQNLYAKWTNISAEQASALSRIAIFNIMEGTYTGKDMGERSIVATIDFPSRIDFQIGDYVEFEIANLERTTSIHGGSGMEKFYIYTMPTVKKVASRLSFGKAFQHTVTFYPCQYELATVKMRDVLQDISSGVIYTGYDEFSFYGGANTLMKRIIAVLDERFGHTGVAGKDYWSYQIADSINEDRNTALEKFQFDFSDSNVMEALLKLNNAEGINTKFFINERMIYVGFKRPYIVGVDANNVARDVPFEFAYGKTSHLPIETNHGNLYTITKSNGSASPITRLYAYGAERNLQRFYCSDRIKTGRYVNKLMLPSFEDDGRTDYIDSPEGIARFGIREGTKTFDNIYPSLRFFYYGNLRDVKYCIKLMGSGLQSDSNDPEHVPSDADGVYDGGTNISKANVTPEQIQRAKEEVDRAAHTSIENEVRVTITVDGVNYSLTVAEADQLINKGSVRIGGVKSGRYHYPIARIQCYRVEELLDGQGNHTGMNYLVESAPPVDLAVFCHATGKVVKCVLYAAKNGQSSTARQLAADGKIPTRTEGGTDYIVGSCFAVHDGHPTKSNKHFECGHLHPSLAYPGLPNSDQRAAWFTDADSISTSKDGAFYKPYDEYKNQVSIHQIHYTDDHWITDVYEFTDYHQETFNRQGYSAYCWPRVNKYYPNSQADNIEVNAVVDVGPVLIEDTDLNTSQGQQQQTFDIYMRDMGFKINDQTWFGDKCFLFDTCKISFLDGNLGGYEFEMPAESDQDKLGSIYVPALAPDGTRNPEFFDLADNPAQAEQAYLNGAFWRIVAKRAETEVDRYWVPNVNLNASAGDHVVFLDIFMPDLYIRVAEQRLYKEAKKYLDANDDGDIQYSFDFDKVRMLKQPTFPLQMREGAIMRVIDDDLDVGTVNAQKTLFEDKNGLVTTTSLVDTSAVTETHDVLVFRNLPYLIEHSVSMCQAGEEDGRYYIELHTSAEDANATIDISEGITVQFADNGNEDYTIYPDEIVQVGAGVFKCYYDLGHLAVEYYIEMYGNSFWAEYNIVTQDVEIVSHVGVYPAGKRIYAIANTLTEFQQGKYYEVEIDLMEPNMAIRDNNMMPIFALANGIGDGQRVYNPDYTVEDITPDEAIIDGVYQYERMLYKFTLPDGFNGNVDYYPAFLCASDGVTEAVHVRLWSIVERDDAAIEDLNYVDLAIDTVTIKFHDNTREKDVSLQDGQEPERLRDNLSEMSREVSATVKEESRATAWAQLMDRMTEAEQLQDQTLDFYQSLVDSSRKHYLELLNLKNNIFDPDGTCKETFLQIMMLQVGADSMNYQLKYTHYSMNGHTANCKVEQGQSEQTDSTSGKLYRDQFKIGNAEEVLDHYVYTDHPTNGEGGRWYPQERNTLWPLHKVVGPDGTTDIYPVYFVALKASRKLPNDCHWVCDIVQHMVNEDDNYFYFNWGILAPESESVGKYALTETRGNAYMYGDNLICGQISTLAGNSYFDLTHGNFVLSKDGPDNQDKYHDGLEYRNGVLIIHGLSDSEGLGKTIKDLGLEIEDMEIGGENLSILEGGKYEYEYTSESGGIMSGYIDLLQTGTTESGGTIFTYLPAGKYVFSAKEIYGMILGGNGIHVGNVTYTLEARKENDGSYSPYRSIQIDNGDNVVVRLETEYPCTFRIKYAYGISQGQTVSMRLLDVMLQRGTKPTSYQDYVKHLADALHGSTEIAGGLTMTNLLMLKDEDGHVQAGMSGLIGDANNPENVAMWAGGSYQDALDQLAGIINTLPLLLTKIGIGSKIGCFRVLNENTVSVMSSDGTSEILISAGENAQDTNIIIKQNGVTKVIISGDEININSVSGYSLTGKRNSGATVTNSNQTVVVEQINLTGGVGAWTVDFEANNVIYGFYVSPLSSIRQIKGTISVYLCNRLIGYANFTSRELSNASYTQEVSWNSTISKFSSVTSALHNLEVRLSNVQVKRDGAWGTDFRSQLSVAYVRFCTRTGSDGSQYVDKSVNFSNVASDDIVQIGRNGIQVSHKSGGFVQMLNDNNDLYVRMFGLPTSIPTGNDKSGKIYNWKGFLRVGGDNSTEANFTDLGFTKFTLPQHILVPNMPVRNTGVYAQDEMYRWGDGDIFINRES